MTIVLCIVLILLFLIMSRLSMIGYGKLTKMLNSLHQGWESKLPQIEPIHNNLEQLQEKVHLIEQQIYSQHTTATNQWNEQLQRQTSLETKFLEVQNALATQENQSLRVYQAIQAMRPIFEQFFVQLQSQENSHSETIRQKIAELFQSYHQTSELLIKTIEMQNIPGIKDSLTVCQIQMQNSIQQNVQEFTKLIQTHQIQIATSITQSLAVLPEQIRAMLDHIHKIQTELQPLIQEVHSWGTEPLVRRRDLQKHKISVFVDFENFFISLWDKDLEIADYQRFKSSLMDPEGQGLYTCERIVFFTNKSRWQRKEFYDKKKNISQKEATLIKENLRNHGCRIIESDSNIDVPLSLLVLKTAQRGDVEEFTLVANDGTYAGLLKELSNMGCQVSGILLGEASGDLVACYKKLGYKRYHIKTREDFSKFGLRTKNSARITSVANLMNQNATTIIPTLLATIRKQRMQFLGPQLQDEVLHAIHTYLHHVSTTTRPELLEHLMDQFSQEVQAGLLTKTKLNNVLNILWKSPCFALEKTVDEASTSISIKPEYTNYAIFRRVHDQVLIQQALDANLVVLPKIWSEFLYGNQEKAQEINEWLQHSNIWQETISQIHSSQQTSNVPEPNSPLYEVNLDEPIFSKEDSLIATFLQKSAISLDLQSDQQEEIEATDQQEEIETATPLPSNTPDNKTNTLPQNNEDSAEQTTQNSITQVSSTALGAIQTNSNPNQQQPINNPSATLDSEIATSDDIASEPDNKNNGSDNGVYVSQILAAIRKQKMQFLKPKLQDRIFRDIHLFLCQKGRMLRNFLTEELSTYLEPYFQTKELTKTKVSGLVAILRKGRALLIEKDQNTGEAFATLAESQRDYSQFRKSHDAVFISVALHEGIDMPALEWSQFLYEDTEHTDLLEQIISEQKRILAIKNETGDDAD